ncbi:Aste57867_12186 [Aphanomyces stellatus]|uniref:Aste57867_12186 protein n=1 Tax=Aphanomyces stellatus TaxID=120398 RepID=A0A485KVI0_9STRA|nr:hypothetical protein As57867_012141 [Aphanomyces stellatus]VFT89040.1 Aste57867_12186 [Aphanomyces stellatus]
MLLTSIDHIKTEPLTSDDSNDLSQIQRKREQSRESTRRWRANEQQTLEALRHQEVQLEGELKTKLEDKTTSDDRRMDLLLAKKRFYVAQNMQLQESLKLRQIKLIQLTHLIQRNAMALLYDDAFLTHLTRQTHAKLGAIQFCDEVEPIAHFGGIHCKMQTANQTMNYTMFKDHHTSLSHVDVGGLVWAALQDKAKFLSLVDRAVDHEKIRTVNSNMVVVGIKEWTVAATPNHIVQRYLILHRECVAEHSTSVTITALTASMSVRPHAMQIEATNTADATLQIVVCGAYCLEHDSMAEAHAALERSVFAHCRFETLLRVE